AVEQILFTRNGHADRDVLAWLINRNIFSISWLQIERSDVFTFFLFADNSELFKEAPAVFLRFHFLIHVFFNADKGICDDAVSLCPGIDDVISCGISQYFFDRFQQIFTDDWIMFRFYS